MSLIKMTDLDLKGKRVLIREDFNVPLKDGKVISTARIEAALPTIEFALKAGAKVILLSHLGRPTEGEYDPALSLAPIAECLEGFLRQKVPLIRTWLQGFPMKDGEVVLCDNVRFCQGEKANDEILARRIAELCDIFVMDAFGVAHRKHTSTYGVARFAPVACAGPLLVAELEALGSALENPERPLVAIVAGSKVSTKLSLLESLLSRADQLILGGGIANTFIAALGFSVGKSLIEADLIDEAKQILDSQGQNKAIIPLPTDVVVATEFSANAKATVKMVNEVKDDEMILDIGPSTAKQFSEILRNAKTIIWNGPVGVFEIEQFSKGTEAIARAIEQSEAFSIAGGGDTIAAIEKFGITNDISYISTGGGAFLKFFEGKKLPAVAVLEERATEWL